MKIRFNLGAGEHYKKWQVKDGKNVFHFNPDKVTLVMYDCKLRNHVETAIKIFNGANKTARARTERSKPEATEATSHAGEQTPHNPKLDPHWTPNGSTADGKTFPKLISQGNKIFSQRY